MKLKPWEIRFAATLLAISAALFVARGLLFAGDGLVIGVDPYLNEELRYLVDDLAFVPISVLLVTLVIERMMELRDRDSLMHKLNMVVGAFFSEVGRPLIDLLRAFDTDESALRGALAFRVGWKAADFETARRTLETHESAIDVGLRGLAPLREFLCERRGFLLGLLQNPNLLEHETFTELLWAVLHLEEELDARTDLCALPPTDAAHLSGDAKRAYRAVLIEWVAYMRHLSEQYPYLYSLAVRQNPFDPAADAEVKE
ncbi:MAG: hypothetical protein FDZ70_08570 [Actinobacteria bacterium]|nr:MAG: hypothetical protein FDZ70_08570 [Actinomycetota bacterium]